MRLALIQNKVSPDIESNLESTLHSIEQAAEQGAKVVCLQELFSSPYFCTEINSAHFSLAQPIPGQLTQRLSEAACQCQVTIIGSVFESAEEKYFNTAVMFNEQGEMLGKYRKIHIPNDPHYWEQYYFSPGNLGYKIFETPHGKIGTLICYDQWFPEAARSCALLGAQIIFYPTAIGWTKAMARDEPQALQNWIDVQRSYAITNHIFVAAANRVGQEKDIDFWGNSFVADPWGRVIIPASAEDPEILIADCDFSQIQRAQSWGFLQNRRPETYGGLIK